MIIESQAITGNKKFLGLKTIRLKDLENLKLTVPEFVAVPNYVLSQLISRSGTFSDSGLGRLSQEIAKHLDYKYYAVRSSSLSEDTKKSSMAGQFRTELKVDAKGLKAAIKNVLQQAFNYSNHDLSQFSLIIQKYIEPDLAGVTFTRNPFGSRDMLIEYTKGQGDKLVSGVIKPKQIRLYWHIKTHNKKLPNLDEAVNIFKKVETYYDFPQDIEWCIKDSKWYFLQSRPITSLSSVIYQQSKYLDKALLAEPKGFLYEKNEVSEMVPRPVPLMFGLLKYIYGKNGPVQLTYNSFNVKYAPKKFLKIFGNQVFSDRSKEIACLFPSQTSSFSFKNYKQTLLNKYYIGQIKATNFYELLAELTKAFDKNKTKIDSIENFIDFFKRDYQLIFKINLLASFEMKKAKLLLKNSLPNLLLLLGQGQVLFPELKKFVINFENKDLKGNSLDISDESSFVSFANKKNSQEIKKWWQSLGVYKQKLFSNQLKSVVILNRLRELSRWLTVRDINILRDVLSIIYPNNPKLLYFATLAELRSGKFDLKKLQQRKERYDGYSNFDLPDILSDSLKNESDNLPFGVSSGIAEGVLVSINDLNKNPNQKNRILYVDVLASGLTKYFKDISGILSRRGGLLSHLAIMARENNLPVIVNFNLAKKSLKIGDHIKIDGAKGTVEKI